MIGWPKQTTLPKSLPVHPITGFPDYLVDVLDLLLHVIHQQVLPKGIRRGEVSLAAANFRHLLHEVNQAIILKRA